LLKRGKKARGKIIHKFFAEKIGLEGFKKTKPGIAGPCIE